MLIREHKLGSAEPGVIRHVNKLLDTWEVKRELIEGPTVESLEAKSGDLRTIGVNANATETKTSEG